MFKKITVILLLCFLVIACTGNGRPKKPDNLISKDKMSEVLYDLYIINAAKGVNRKLLEANGFVPETYVLTKYNIDSLQFALSNTYYSFDTNAYKTIVEQVKSRLEREKEELEALQKTEDKAAKRKQDSINKLKTKKNDSTNKFKRKFLRKGLENSVTRKATDDDQVNVVISNVIPTLTGSAQVLLFNDVPAVQTGIIKKLTVNAINNGSAQFQVVKRQTFNNIDTAGSSDTFEPVSLHTVAVTVGVNDYEVDIPINQGEYLAWASTPGQPKATYGATVGTGWWQGAAGPLRSATPLTYQPFTICFSYEIINY
jgi:hypothetical protein